MEYLGRALQNREVNFNFIRIDSDLRPIHSDPLFIDLLERAGIKPPPAEYSD